ncbi:hypothetical protein VTN77DRAFT_7052 [Rasamsonia byssochlamydoides]|uniref:uncharacterized protein n=1 Tax=Rasamsonia byssochlamydoides TaxID=89139 RepID=UPI003742E4FA
MVLRKPPPPGIDVPPRGTGAPSTTSPISNSSQSSPNRLTRQRPSPTASASPRQVDISVYSPDLNTSPAFDLMSLEEAQQRSPLASSFNDSNPWAEELVERPDSSANLHSGSQSQEDAKEESKAGISRVPPILMEGTARRQAEELQRNQGGDDFGVEEKWETGKQRLQSNNPFLRARNPSPNPWEDGSHPSQPQRAPEQNQNLWATNSHEDPFGERISQSSGIIPMTARLSLLDQEDPWTQQNGQSGHTPETSTQHQPVSSDNTSTMCSASTFDGTASGTSWVDGSNQSAQTSNNHDQEIGANTVTNGDPQSSQPGQPTNAPDLTNGSSGASNLTPNSSQDLLDLDDATSSNQTQPVEKTPVEEKQPENEKHEQSSLLTEGLTLPQGDNLPSTSEKASVPSRPAPPPLSEAEMKKQLEKQAETYAIRHINWTDNSGELRESPVLVQNKNGPCPLLALVNGLVMRSEKNAQPPIVKALQTREQISLGLLIQALFDELTTYHGEDEELPDIEALSRFLTMLHTGMNVNPRLTLESPSAVGSFLETNDLRLYGTFKVPLVHGWIASPSSEAHAALSRVAQYHEDIQLLQFRKEELEDRVFRGGSLNADEEQLIRDIDTIEHFVNVENATQLSAFGLDHLAQTLAPGSISILFRNDHFSTLYKHPQSHQLFTLITDAGYADHAEIVWESLVDVNGSNAEFFAGDFRPVGHTAPSTNPAGQRSSSNAITNHNNTTSTQHHTEQTDADYAYALSLQFQEEARRENARNRRASTPYYNTSAQLSTSSRTAAHNRSSSTISRGNNSRSRYHGAPPAPPQQNMNNLQRPAIPPRNSRNIMRTTPVDPHDGRNDDDDAPPPSYEQVARSKAYEAQRGRSSYDNISPNYSAASADAAYGRSPRLQQPYSSGAGRRQPGVVAPAGSGPQPQPERVKEKSNKDCVVM